MTEHFGEKFESVSLEAKPDIPKIFELISSGANPGALAQQAEADFKAGKMEETYLGLEKLMESEDGESLLLEMSEHKSGFAATLKMIFASPHVDYLVLENALNIQRWGEMFDVRAMSTQQMAYLSYHYSSKKGYTSLSYEDFLAQIQAIESGGGHLEDTIDSQILVRSNSFGNDEPSYLELLGPLGILELRSLAHPNFLLLGSLGAPSARHFQKYAAKINPDARPHVIDVDLEHLGLIKSSGSKNSLSRADARILPFADGSMDSVSCNHLFHFMYDMLSDGLSLRAKDPGYVPLGDTFETDLRALLGEAFRVLRPGRHFTLVERPWGKAHADNLLSIITKLAGEEGFLATGAPMTPSFAVGFDNGSTVVDESGFPHYEDKLLFLRTNMGLMFTKP